MNFSYGRLLEGASFTILITFFLILYYQCINLIIQEGFTKGVNNTLTDIICLKNGLFVAPRTVKQSLASWKNVFIFSKSEPLKLVQANNAYPIARCSVGVQRDACGINSHPFCTYF